MSRSGKNYVHEKHHPFGRPQVKKVGPPVISEQALKEAKDFLNGIRPTATADCSSTGKQSPC